MQPDTIRAMPPERLLTVTDFPSSRRETQATKPGDVRAAEALIAEVHEVDRMPLVAANYQRILETSAAGDRIALLD